MTNRFKRSLAFVLRWEGGKVDDPLDRGGRTAFGITQRTYDAWRTSLGFDPRDVWTIASDEVEAIYESRYWCVCRCDALPEGLDLAVFDSAVNHGTRKAIQFIQRAVGVVDDGDFGPQTMRAIDQRMAESRSDLLARFVDARADFYEAIIRNDPKQSRFAKGWDARLDYLRDAVGVA